MLPYSGYSFYLYNANGNETRNLSQNMTSATYNHMNLPASVSMQGGNGITFRYLADGRRVESVSETWGTPLIIPAPLPGLPPPPPMDVVTYDTERRFGQLTFRNGIPVRYDFLDGYFSLYDDEAGVPELHPYLYITDHLGSVRLTVDGNGSNSGTANARQGMEYLPSGAIFRSTDYDMQTRRFCGKELLTMHGWNMYDSQARYQYSLLPRFSTMDPLAENYYSLSPYNYAGNDWPNAVDPDGREPGDWFATMNAAAIDFGKMYNDNSIRERREYDAAIFIAVNDQGEIGFSYNIPTIGDEHSVMPNTAPWGARTVASIHTHANYSEGYWDNCFSGSILNGIQKTPDQLKNTREGDIGIANKKQEISYLASSNGTLQKYDPIIGRISTISSNLPSDPMDPDRKNSISVNENRPFNLVDFASMQDRINKGIGRYRAKELFRK